MATTEQRQARLETGAACSNVFLFDDKRGRHCVITVHFDGSGSIGIYNSEKCRELSRISVRNIDDFRLIRDAIDSQTASADMEKIRRRRARGEA